MLRLAALDKAFERHILSSPLTKAIDIYALQEGLISALWQAWCQFCRDTVIGATQGATTRGGAFVNSPIYSANTSSEIAYVAKMLARSQKFSSIKSVKGNHQEPTWGDLGKLNLIITGLSPTNSATLLSGFGGKSVIYDLQICRNASAHISADTISLIKSAKVRYMDTKFQHPSDIMKWIDPSTKDFLWKSWVEDMDIMSDLSTQ